MDEAEIQHEARSAMLAQPQQSESSYTNPSFLQDDGSLATNSTSDELFSENNEAPISSVKTFWQRLDFRNNLDSFRIEPIAFIICLSTGALLITVQNYYLWVICLNNYNSTDLLEIENNCFNLNFSHDQEVIIQEIGTVYGTYRTLIETLIPAILAILWYGEWCDKYGSKPLLILPLIGNSLSALAFFLLHHYVYMDQTPELLLLASVPMGLFGGGIATGISWSTYMMKVVPPANRATRLGILELIVLFSITIGLYGGREVQKLFGYGVLFITAFIINAFSVFLTIILVDSKDRPANTPKLSIFNKKDWYKVFNVIQAKETIWTLLKAREGTTRLLLLILFVFAGINVFTFVGPAGLVLQFTRIKYGWDEDDITTFTIIQTCFMFIGILFGSVVCIKWFKLPELIVILIAAISYSTNGIIWSVSNWSGMMYIGSFLGCMYGICEPLLRSIISKIIPFDEIGKINCCFSIMEAIVPLIAGPVYNGLYKQTVSFFPGTAFLINAIIALLNIGVLGIFYYFYRRSNHFFVH